MVDYELGAVYRAVGYHGSELPGVPYDARRGVIPNQAGRVTEADGTVIPGVYTNGWIKRGPVGLIGHTKGDANETVECIVQDLENGALNAPSAPEESEIEALLDSRSIAYTTWDGWYRLDEHERSLGEAEGRERVKVVERDDMLNASVNEREHAS